jgi:O-acetyl-ADP-ribose deacetylase (regulator of RNase III)
VIHAVGPVYHGGAPSDAELLASCYRRSLEVAIENKIKSIAFAAISCGIYGYPVPEAARIALTTVKTFVESHPQIELVRFVLFSDDVLKTFLAAAEEVL